MSQKTEKEGSELIQKLSIEETDKGKDVVSIDEIPMESDEVDSSIEPDGQIEEFKAKNNPNDGNNLMPYQMITVSIDTMTERLGDQENKKRLGKNKTELYQEGMLPGHYIRLQCHLSYN